MALKQLLFLAFLTQVPCEKHSGTFVIDDTFSLVDDIKQVKNASQLILDMVLEKSEIEDYVLVTFNNPDTEIKKKTGDPKELTQALDTIKVHAGNKTRCSEIVLTGIKRALNESRDGSYVFVFTDASAMDYDQFEEVKAMCQKKNNQIYFIVSGHCGDISTRRYQVYHKLAAACKGQAITIHKDDIAQVPAYLKKIIKGDRTVTESAVFPANRWRNVQFTIDDLTDNYIISASGINVDLKIVNARKWPVHIDNSSKIAWTRNFKAFEPSKLKDGVYTLKVRSESPVEVTIMARTNFTFEYGFSVVNVTSLNATDPHPFTDIKTRLVIFVKDPEGSTEVRGVALHSVTGKVSKPLTPVMDKVYTTEEFLSTKEPFRIAVKGIAKKTKKTVKSFSKQLVVPIQPGSVEQIKVKEGASIDIRCRTPSNKTKSHITWYERQKEGYFSVLSGQTKEVLHVKKPVYKVYYKCVARNATGYDQYNAQLDLSVRPEFFYPPSVILVNIGDPVTIECKIFKGNPWPDITWQFKHDNATTYEPMAQQSDTFNIASAGLEHSGEYRCFASSTEGTDEKITRVLVQVAPEIMKTDDYFTIKEGVPIDVKCSILKGIPKPVITWYSKQEDATDFEEIVDETNEILHLINAKISKSYKCEANNSAGSDFNIVKIDVEARPEFRVTTPNITINEGDPVTIDCKLRKGSPPLERSWEKRLNSTASFKTLRHEGEELNIPAVEYSQAGEYKCVAENPEGRAEKITELIIRVVPVIENVAPNKTALEGSNVALQCRIKQGFPKPTVNWFYKSPEVTEFFFMSKTGEVLLLENIKVSYTGDYKCVVENEVGQAEQIVQLMVNGPPKIVFIPPNTSKHSAVEGDPTLRLPCTAAGHPTPNITWLVDGKIVSLDRCQLPKDTGPCRAGHTRWYYDTTLKECRQFTYGGCQGNDNRFESEVACRSECGSPITEPVTIATPDKCQLPKDTGPCRAGHTRWYYDTTLKECRKFTYGGCQGNDNRFESEALCRSECRSPITEPVTIATPDKCQLPKDTGPCRAGHTRWYYDTTLKECRKFTYGGCQGNDNRFESEALCRSECRSPITEPVTIATPDKCQLPKDTGPCRAGHTRWYYDTTLKECRKFTYGGCQGNDNRFESEALCRSECRSPITEPVTIATPDKCQLPKDTGPCRAGHTRWYYDTTLKECRKFTYGGCQGNDNRFESEALCRSECRSPITEPVTIATPDKCQLPKDTGPCRAGHTRWYYDTTLKECRKFTYGGCQGNDNRFESEALCRSECRSPITEPVTIATPEKCQQPMEEGPCQASFLMWYFDSTQKTCREFTYGGCNGNENRFQSEEECRGVCLPPALDKCQLSKDTGPCRAGHTRWYYDKTLEKCLRFIYGGCQGNDNRFESEAVCRSECGASITEPGKYESIYVEGNVLIIQNPKEAKSSKYHTYVCRATNEVGEDTQTYEVVITDHIEFSKGNETYGIYMQPYDIKCPLPHTDPSLVKWYKNSKPIADKTGPLLHFDDPTELDNGNYTCRVSGLTDSPSHTVQVIFGFPPTRDKNIYNVEWGENQRSLNCYSLEYPEGKYEWFYNGENIGWNKETINITHGGEYICNVKNPLGSLDITYKVTTPDKGCRVPKSLFTSKHAPLVLDSSLSWPILQTVQDHFLVPHSEKLQLICQDDSNSPSKNSFANFPNLESLYATCEEEDLFWVDGSIRKISEFECKQNVMPGVRQTKLPCLGENTELMQVGFSIDGFTEVYQSCMDLNKLVPLYTKMNTIPAERTELRAVSDASSKESCVDESECCYERIQLVNATDVSFGPAKSATTMYNQINSVNYCKLKNDFDWYNIEMISRSEINFTVWTGASKYMEVDTEDKTIDTPRYLWKVLRYYSGSDEEIIAIIHENVDRPGPRLCAGACGNKSILFVPSGQRTYCCSLEDFKKALGVDIDLTL